MADINAVTLTGRLTRDAELKDVGVCTFSLAVNRRKKEGDEWVEEASFFDCAMWGKRGEAIAQYLTKGKEVCIHGTLRQDRWEKDGNKRSRVVITVNDLKMFGGKSSQDEVPF